MPGILRAECRQRSGALETKGVADGDDFVVNGQKIWTSYAHIAEQCLLVVRTDPAAAKHKGLTCLLVDMKTSGISVRPLKMMSGDSGFNEMFFTNVRVPKANVLGQVNDGWNVAITALEQRAGQPRLRTICNVQAQSRRGDRTSSQAEARRARRLGKIPCCGNGWPRPMSIWKCSG